MTRPARGRRVNHTTMAATLRAHPGVWQHVNTYPSSPSAKHMAWVIRTGYCNRWYLPAGAFEARTEIDGDGTTVVARYIGTPRKDGA